MAHQPGQGTTPSDEFRQATRARRVRGAKALGALVVAVIILLFVVQNDRPAKVDFLVSTRHPSLIWLIVGCLVIGGVIGFFLGRPGRQLPRLHDKPKR